MPRFSVKVYISETYDVEAADEFEAEEKALRQLRNMNCVPIADMVEVTPLDDEEEDEEEAYLKAEREGIQMY